MLLQMWSAADELISRGADIRAKNQDGRTPLQVLAAACSSGSANLSATLAKPATPEHDLQLSRVSGMAASGHRDNGSASLPQHASSEQDTKATVQLVRRSAVFTKTPEKRRKVLDRLLQRLEAQDEQ